MLTLIIIFIAALSVLFLGSWLMSVVVSGSGIGGQTDKTFKDFWGAFWFIIIYPITLLLEQFIKYWERLAGHWEGKLDQYHERHHDKEKETKS